MSDDRRQLRVHGPDDLRLDTVTCPAPGAADVVVRVHACGVCGSDLGYLSRGGMRGPTGTPLALGHEFAGTIESIGDEVRDLHRNMRVVVNPDDNFIGAGGSEGGFSEYVLVRGARKGGNIHPIPDHLPMELAALTEPLAVSLHGVNRAQVERGSRVVVFGAGMIGLGVVIALRRRGVTDIVVVDLQDERLDIARRLGASTTVNPGRDDLRARLASLHGQSRVYGMPVVDTDIYIDAAGAAGLLQQAIQVCRTRARIVVVAVYRQPVAIDLVMVMAKEIELTGSIAYPGNEFAEVIAMLSSGELDVTPLISHRFPFDDVVAAFAQAKDTTRALKVMINHAC